MVFFFLFWSCCATLFYFVVTRERVLYRVHSSNSRSLALGLPVVLLLSDMAPKRDRANTTMDDPEKKLKMNDVKDVKSSDSMTVGKGMRKQPMILLVLFLRVYYGSAGVTATTIVAGSGGGSSGAVAVAAAAMTTSVPLMIDIMKPEKDPSSEWQEENAVRRPLYRYEKSIIAGTLGVPKDRVPQMHGLMEAIHNAFAMEVPLILSPDVIQLAIVQFVARWVNANPSKYQVKLGVQKDGKQEIEIIRDQLSTADTAEQATPKWATCFPEFQSEINKRLKSTPVLQAIQTEFSTTTEEDRLTRVVALMDTVQHFFTYVVRTRCGIPKVGLLGTAKDWQSMMDSLQAYETDLEMGRWTKAMRVVLGHFVRALDTKQKPDAEFWKSIYSFHSGSGGNYISGWSLLFAPHTTNLETLIQPEYEWKTHNYVMGMGNVAKYGSGLSTVPFLWKYVDVTFPMKFLSGFAAPQTSGEGVKPSTGWAVSMNSKEQARSVDCKDGPEDDDD